MKLTVAQILAEYLKDVGVRHIFGVNAHSLFDITDAVYLEPAIKFVPAQIEISASYMATAYARAARQLGVCLGSAGAGATNLVTGVAMAFKESCPVLVISSEVDTDVAGKGASSWHEVPQEEFFRPITKMGVTLRRAEEALDVLQQAVRTATSGRMGPVYVGIPRDLQVEAVDLPSPPWPNGHAGTQTIDSTLVDRAAEELIHAASPTIIAGGGVHWAQCADEVRELAELLQIPFGTTPSQKGLISEEHPLSLGVFGFGAFPFAHKACLESDVILALGTTFSEALTLGYGHQVIPEGAKIIQVDVDATEIGKSYPVHLAIVGDVKLFVQELLARLRASGPRAAAPSERIRRIQEEKQAWRAELARRGAPADGPITEWQMYHALREAIPEDTVIAVEGGTGQFINRFFATHEAYSGGDFRPIGHGLSTAIGLKFAFPERPVLSVSGDGSFMMEMQELATAMRENLPIVLAIVHNGAYGGMKRDQIRHYEGRVIGTDLYIPDLRTLGSAFGAHVERVERPSHLVDAIGTAFAANKTALLDIVCPIEGI